MANEVETKKKSKEIDMLHGGIAGKLIVFALPLACSSILQQLFNSADVAVVGRFAGDAALSAVGSCVALVGIFVNLLVGLSVGPNAVLAMLIGKNERDKIGKTLHTSLTFGAILGVALMLIGWLIARPILTLSDTPEGVLEEALVYIRIYFISLPFMMIYNFGSAALRSYGDSRRPMWYLLLSGTVNVILNLVLVIGAGMGVSGVAVATVISNILSASLTLIHLHRRTDEFRFRFHGMCIDKKVLIKILKIGIPSGIQGAIFSISNVFIQGGINSFGEDAIAGSSVALNFEYFTYDIASAFSQAAVTFTSQNYYAGNIKRCKRIFGFAMLFGVVFTEILSLIFIVWSDFFVGIYTTGSAVAAFALIRMYHVCTPIGITATYEVASAALRGMGHSLEPAVFTVLGTVVFRLIWLATVFRQIPTFETLMDVYPASWIFTGIVLFITYAVKIRKAEKRNLQ